MQTRTKAIGMWYNILLSWPVFVVCFWVNVSWCLGVSGPALMSGAVIVGQLGTRNIKTGTSITSSYLSAPAIGLGHTLKVYANGNRLYSQIILFGHSCPSHQRFHVGIPLDRSDSTHWPAMCPCIYVYHQLILLFWVSSADKFVENSADLHAIPEMDIFYEELVTGLQNRISTGEISIYVWFRWDWRILSCFPSTNGRFLGLPVTLMTSFGPPLVTMAIFALVYPFVGTAALDDKDTVDHYF